MTHTRELHDKIADQTSKARRSMREVKVPLYFSISAVLLWFIPKRLTKQRSFIAIIPWHIEATIPFCHRTVQIIPIKCTN